MAWRHHKSGTKHGHKDRLGGLRVFDYLEARLAFTVAAFNLLIQWYGLKPAPDGFFSLVHRRVQSVN